MSILTFFVLTLIFTAVSCDNEPVDSLISGSSNVIGTYYMTAYNSSILTDLDDDGIESTNQMDETNCYTGSFITLKIDGTFIASNKGPYINSDGGISTIECFNDGDYSGTWTLSGTQLTMVYLYWGVEVTDVVTLSNNTIVSSVEDGEVIGITSGGEYEYLTSNIQIVYTK